MEQRSNQSKEIKGGHLNFQKLYIGILGLLLILTLMNPGIVWANGTLYKPGDVNNNGLINAEDALLVLQHSVNKVVLDQAGTAAGDVTADEQINATDALLILQYAVGLIEIFPVDSIVTSEPEKPTPSEPDIPMPSNPDDSVSSKPDIPTPSKPEDPASSEPEPPIPSEPDNSPKVVEINATYFPDEVFRTDVIAFDLNCDGWLSENEIAKVIEIDVSRYTISIPGVHLEVRPKITSLVGIEYFTELKSLLCQDNALTTLDISQNTKLMSLHCGANQLTELKLENNPELYELECGFNSLTELDLTSSLQLHSLICCFNKITVLDLTNNSLLTHVDCDSNVVVIGYKK